MSREYFEAYKPVDKTLSILTHIVEIIQEYAEQGLTLTLRQLYYQLVSKDLIKNEEKSYKRIGEIVSRARRGGMLNWDALEDRVRVPARPPEYKDLNELINAALNSYRLPRLKGQDSYVELWVEKDALAGVLAPIASKYHITLMVNRGYSSTSAMKDAGERLRHVAVEMEVDQVHVLYLGDLDPSGEDMVRDVGQRLDEYVNSGWLLTTKKKGKETVTEFENEHDRALRLYPHINVEVTKIALTMEQVKQYKPPPNYAKTTDSRAKGFIKKHGKKSWEVDALPPRVLRDLIEADLDRLINPKLVKKIVAQEEKDKKLLTKAVVKLQKTKPKRKPKAKIKKEARNGTQTPHA